MSAFDKQVGGDHYKSMKIQPVEYISANGLGFLEGNVIKYITRYKVKGGAKDLEKAIHCLELLIEQIKGEGDEKCCKASSEEVEKQIKNGGGVVNQNPYPGVQINPYIPYCNLKIT